MPLPEDITEYQAKYVAHELTKRSASDDTEKLAGTLLDVTAQIDLNPHQVDAALFAFRSPLSKGAVLADEVGLGKTIEAGLVISQKWAEQKRRILIIVPANLRKQWNGEMLEKFYLPSTILESKNFNTELFKYLVVCVDVIDKLKYISQSRTTRSFHTNTNAFTLTAVLQVIADVSRSIFS